MDYLRSLGLIDDDDLYEFLKKFPGVLIGCSLEHELRSDLKILEKDRGIKGKLINLYKNFFFEMLIEKEIVSSIDKSSNTKPTRTP